MGRTMGGALRGIKPGDYVLAGILAALGVLMGWFDVHQSDASVTQAIAGGSMVHTMSSHSVWMIPVFAAAAVPVLWWRRSVLLVTGIAAVIMALHDVLFGWVTRCGFGLPLALVLTFLGALTYGRAKAWLAAGLSALLAFAVVAVDATTGPGVIGLVLPVILVVFGIGRAARHRALLKTELSARDAELRRLRDERAAIAVTDGRAQLSRQLDGLLAERLAQLTTVAESGGGLGPDQAKALLEEIETGSRDTLDDMREIVGLLRGGDAELAPTPTVAHLQALLTRREPAHARLTVTGNPRSLPASVELSAYRIVEHLLAALADQPDSPVAVALRFDEAALEIRVTGPVSKSAEVKEIIARAKERARVLGGTLDVKIARGQAGAVAQLPVLG
jgi:signal transduction histidine kinase